MELARIMATRRPAATTVFAAEAGEEQNLYDRRLRAQTYQNASVNVQGMFPNDILGSSTADDGTKDPYTVRLFGQGIPTTESAARSRQQAQIGCENDSPARELARFVVGAAENKYTQMNIPMVYRLDRFLRGGDHRPFFEAGFAACRFTEPNQDFAHQHQDVGVENGTQFGDLIELVDLDYIARVGSQFTWLAYNDTLTAGFEALWRPTDAPLWTHAAPLGKGKTTKINLSKDNGGSEKRTCRWRMRTMIG